MFGDLHVVSHRDQIVLTAHGVQLVLDLSSGAPVVRHWGSPLGDVESDALRRMTTPPIPHSIVDTPQDPGVMRERGRAFHGRPALSGNRNGLDWAPLFTIVEHHASETEASVRLRDAEARLAIDLRYRIEPSGIVLVDLAAVNDGSEPYRLEELTTWMPLPERAAESLDFTGRWLKERQPQRRPIAVGSWVLESREGRSGHGASVVQCAMTGGAGFADGEVWALGLLWSGEHRHLIERGTDGRSAMGAGELLQSGEMVLQPGDRYEAPTVAAAYSDEGLDGLSSRYHEWLRARPEHPTRVRPRPVTLNVWEAVYFDHDLERLSALVDVAAEVGVERFVLDDGWFGARRDDRAGLGDWVVSDEVWPQGLDPLIDRVTAAGMEFGLWFEGEMVNPDSDLYRAHPEWILHVPGRIPPTGRNQQVLDLTHDGAYEHVLGQVDALLSKHPITYIKWDHNRPLVDPAHLGRAAVHNQTVAIYRLFDELKSRHPGLEIESCASGGGRVDLGMAMHVDRFWASDSNDALERQEIQRYSMIAIPPEMLGTHIGPSTSHSSSRSHSLSFRAATALFGHAGIEWDITETTNAERSLLAEWAAYYKANRELLHSGRVVRVDHTDSAALVHGVVAHDRSAAIFCYAQVAAAGGVLPSPALIPGLDPDARYRVRRVEPAGRAPAMQHADPMWVDGVITTGAALATIGLRPPILHPEQAILIEIVRA
ncbi:alpha-galactosidase [Agromyces sp. ISL-38]|uniref:alpha-galactosidase n=1 Tax=Agromyces sp. ISL-38 TaxID=2819107 RepID=UPI0027DF0E53|nr:alpha-galactosidase [Agromyces sp. ISL-38]